MADWAKLKVVDLKAELKRRGLPQGGLKTELIARLEEADQEAVEPQGEEQAEEQVEEAPVEEHAQVVNGDSKVTEDVQEEPKVEEHVEEDAKEDAMVDVPHAESPAKSEPAPETAPEKPVESEPTPQSPAPILSSEPAPAQQTKPEPEPQTSVPESQSAEVDTPMNEAPVDTSIEPTPEAQKRKRRSASPPPKEEDVARKRARAENEFAFKPFQIDTSRADVRDAPVSEIDYERHVEPSVHPATSALCINNLMRPLRPGDLRAHIVTLASAPGTEASDDIVAKFHLDFIRTHAFVALDSVSAASRVRQLLHGRVWPNESNRKALSIDFIPPEKIDSWIDMEEQGGRRPGHRWEVIYTPTADGSSVEADLVSNSISASSNRPPPTKPPVMPADSINSAPLGPRGAFSDNPPPTGPRGPRRPPQQAPTPSGETQYTRARPSVAYNLVSDDLARRRVESMRNFYTRDLNRDLGREINRYSFEDGDSFVDRGREIFEGIRPPHRERGGRGGGRGRGGRSRGGGGFRPRSDRYIPGGMSGRGDDDRRRF